MRSPGRPTLERGLRALALAALVGMLWHVFRDRTTAAAVRARSAGVEARLVAWTTREPPSRAHVEFDSPPDPETRDWLAALGRTGTQVTWRGATPPPNAVTVEPVPDPRHPARVWVAAPAATPVVLQDELGVVDSVTVSRVGARLVLPHLEGTLRAVTGTVEATAAAQDSLLLRPLLVVGKASWEAKFTIAALEEHGWKVEARLAVAPSGDVRQGAARVAIDTGRYAAVVAIDSVATRYARQLARYVRSGGGLIAVGEAAALVSLAPFLPASVTGPPSLPRSSTTEIARASPRAALALAPLGRLKAGAIALETQRTPAGDEEIAAAAWRVGEGRVLQVGYHDTWRWRLAGVDPDAPDAHRAWWAALVSSVAHAPRVPTPVEEPLEPTPLASLVSTLGPPKQPLPARWRVFDDPRFVPILFAVLIAALLLEWFSRRLRGER